MPPDATRTKAALVEAAERLFGERGLHGVSMREISMAAGQANNNAAVYHFGNREGLIEAVVVSRMSGVNAARHRLLADLGEHATLVELVRALVLPLARAGRRHPSYLALLAHLLVDKTYMHLITPPRPWTTSVDAVIAGIDGHLVHLPREIREQRRWLSGTLLLHTLAGYHGTPTSQPYRNERELLDGLVNAVVAILSAPS